MINKNLMKKMILPLLVAPFLFLVSCETSKSVWSDAQSQLKANATGSVGFGANGQGGYAAKAQGSTGLFGYDVYGNAEVGFKKSVPVVPPVVPPVVETVK